MYPVTSWSATGDIPFLVDTRSLTSPPGCPGLAGARICYICLKGRDHGKNHYRRDEFFARRDPPRLFCEYRRHDHRVVRLSPVWHRGCAHLQQALLSSERSVEPHADRVSDL